MRNKPLKGVEAQVDNKGQTLRIEVRQSLI